MTRSSSGGSAGPTADPEPPTAEAACKETPAECKVGPTAKGSYTSPEFPSEDDGNVLEWGFLIVNATFSDPSVAEENITVGVYAGEGGQLITTYELDRGTDTYEFDLRAAGIDPDKYPELQLQAMMKGTGGQCMVDIVPTDDAFWGMPTGLNESNTIIGIERNANTDTDPSPLNYGAWYWNDGDTRVTSLHGALPTLDGTGDPWLIFDQSVASDINNAGIIVGWADHADDDNSSSVDENCTYGPLPVEYFPTGVENTNYAGGADDPGRMQWIVHPQAEGWLKSINVRDRSSATPKTLYGSVTIGFPTSTPLSGDFEANWVQHTKTVVAEGAMSWTTTPDTSDFDWQIPVPLGWFYYNPSYGPILIEMSRYERDSNAPLFETGDDCGEADDNRTIAASSQGEAVATERYSCPVSTELVFDAEPKAIESAIVWAPDPDGAYVGKCLPVSPDSLHDNVPSSDFIELPQQTLVRINEQGTIAASAGAVRTYYQNEKLQGRASGGVGGYSTPFGTLTIWMPDGNGPLLPAPHVVVEGYGYWDGETNSLPPVALTGLGNDDNETLIGVAAYEIPCEPVNDRGIGGNCGWDFQAMAWGYQGLNYAGHPYHRADNLSEALYYSADYNDWALRDGFPYCSDSALLELYLKYAEGLGTNPITYEAFASINRCDDECVGNYLVYAEEAGSSAEPYSAAWVAFNCEPIPNPYPKQVIPLDIDDQGNIIGVFRRPYRGVVAEAVTGDEYVAVKWTRSYYGLERYYFYTATILEDGFGNDGAPVRTAQLSQMHEFFETGLDISFSASASIDDNRTYFSTKDAEGYESAWTGYLDETRELAGMYGAAIVTGAYRTTAVGIATDVYGEGQFDAFADFDGEDVNLGAVNPGLPAIPLFANGNERIVGTHVVANGEKGAPRVFKWDRCEGDMPRLDDWTVTYRSDRNPAWSFEVELADICTQSLSNQAEISTSTPEITLDNNSSRAEMVVNTADLAVELSVSPHVVSPASQIADGGVIRVDAAIMNNGPGSARDIIVEMRPPEGCEIDTSEVINPDGLSLTLLGTDQFSGAIRIAINSMEANEGLFATFDCYNTIEDAGTELTAAIAVSSPTIDCVPGNDAHATGVIVGNYPNLWVTLSGPPSSEVGAETPYELSFGNNGNDDSNGTIVVALPAGTSFEWGCGSNCTPPGFTVNVTQPTPTTSGEVTLVPTTPYGFFAGYTATVPFTLTWTSCEAANGLSEILAEAIPALGFTDASIADNSALASTLVTAPLGALTLHVDRSDTSAEDEHEVLYTFHYSNDGYLAAVGTWMSFEMPAGVVIEEIIPSTNDGATIDVGRGTLKSLLPGDTGSVVVRARVTGPVGAPGLATLNAGAGACGVTAPIVAPTLQPNDTGVHVLVSPSVGSTCEGEGLIDWTVTVTNPNGTATANTPISVTIPAGLAYVAGSIRGQGGIDVRAPELLWLASIPGHGVLSFTYQTKTTTDVAGVLFTSALAGQATGSGSVVVDCDDRVTVTKAWDLTCGVANDTFGVTITVKNGTDDVISGTLYDTFQDGVAFGDDGLYTEDVVNLLPGREHVTRFTFSVTNPLLFADPIFNRAVFDSASTGQVASNQVAGAVMDCGAVSNCQAYSCEPLVGCVGFVPPHPEVETCGNTIDDNCNGATDEGGLNGAQVFVTVGEACDSVLPADGTDQCVNDAYECQGNTMVCDVVVAAVETCDGEDNNCVAGVDEGFTFNGLGLDAPCDDDDNGTCARGIVECNQAGTAAICNEPAGVDLDTVACSAGVGVCRTTGKLRCDGTCDAPIVSTTGLVELCDNGLDDNCNGTVDTDFAAIAQIGTRCDSTVDSDICETGFWVCDTEDRTQVTCTDDDNNATELCNGIDDDCDGQTDEDWKPGNSIGFPGVLSGLSQTVRFLGESCDGSNDQDRCELGVVECSADFTTVYCHEDGLGLEEICDIPDVVGGEVDEDCDGQFNEGFSIDVICTTPGLGACAVPGVFACSEDDNTTSECVPNAGQQTGPITEVCDGIDNDCDGVIDDNNPNGVGVVSSVCPPIETDIVTGPPAITSSTTATFTYVNPLSVPVPAHTTFQCSLDGGVWTTCNHVGATPSLTYSNLPAGQHTLLVRATRSDGAVDPTPDFWTWIIDTTVPDTTIVAAPTNPSQNPSGTFAFGSPTPNPDFYSCVLDPVGGVCPATGAATYAVCPTPYAFTNLADGSHTMCVYVTNTAGTPDPTPATYTWIIDTTAPETEIVTVIPPKVTGETTVVFNYIDPTAPTTNTFECSLDGSEWADCDGKTETYTNLTEGEHVFEVRTVDPNGVVDPTPASYTFVVDLTAPCPTIALQPANPAQSGTAIFGFTASEADVTYFCALDAALVGGQPAQSAYVACPATATFSDLADGNHSLWVYAVDVAGNIGTCRANYAWLIDTRYPETEITDGPTPLVGSGEEVTLVYIDPTNEDLITFQCSLDGAAFTRCDGTEPGEGGTIDYADLPVGQHTFEVRACDFTKAPPVQCDPTPATWTWEVTVSPCPNDRTAPAIACAADLVLECVDGGGTVDLDDVQPTATDACDAVTTTSATGEVALGQSPLVFSSVDGNGNVSSCVTLVTVSDTAAPTISCPADLLTAGTDPGLCSADLDIAAATGSDACQGTAGLLALNDAPTVFAPGETIVTHHLIDAFGNEATCTQTVVVTDDEDLVLTCSESATVDADADKCEWTGKHSALATDNCSDELTIDVEGTYPVGVSPILFTAADGAGNSAECTTQLTVRDVTDPVVACGTPIGVLPTVIRATASDACGTLVTLENVACVRVIDGASNPIALTNCPITINGDSIEITGRLSEGELVITYDARAVDPSGNFAVTSCTQTYDPDQDGDGVIDAEDNCVLTLNGDQTDSDEDGIGDLCDICPDASDPAQADRDNDGVGDACSDKDKDGVLDIEDNCEVIANGDQLDVDDDELGDVCDPAPYEGLTAEGDGGCASGGGAGSVFGGLLGLLGIFMAFRARRR